MEMNSEQGISWAQFQAFRAHLPFYWDEDAVAQFHRVIEQLETSFGIDLQSFRIPDAEMKPRVISVRRASYSGRAPGQRQLSEKLYCSDQFALRQIDGIVYFLEALQPRPQPQRIGF
jgi:hypothetical protein